MKLWQFLLIQFLMGLSISASMDFFGPEDSFTNLLTGMLLTTCFGLGFTGLVFWRKW
jgi:hypothetical protein